MFGGWSRLINLDGFEERRYLVRVELLLTLSCPTLRGSGELRCVAPTAPTAPTRCLKGWRYPGKYEG